jgi:hypothetical protein
MQPSVNADPRGARAGRRRRPVMADKKITPKPPVSEARVDGGAAAGVTKTTARKLQARKLQARKLQARKLQARKLQARKLQARKLQG